MTEEPEKPEEVVITLTFENAANETKTWQVAAISSDLMRDYVGRAAKTLFAPTPSRVGIATKDGAIIQSWSDKTVQEVVEQYKTNHIVIGTPDQLGLSFSKIVKPKNKEKILCPYFTICATPQYHSQDKEIYIKQVCKTEKYKQCTHKMSWDTHFANMSEPDRIADMKQRKDQLLYQRIERFVKDPYRDQSPDYLVDQLLKLFRHRRPLSEIESFCKDHEPEWLAEDILKMIRGESQK